MTGQPLVATGSHLAARGGPAYPVVSGVPVLLAAEEDRDRVATTDWAASGSDGSAVAFYNGPDHHSEYCRAELAATRDEIQERYERLAAPGPALEVGAGMGALQGVGQPYVALDYSLTALLSFIDPHSQRVCASAEALPFPDSTFTFVYSVAVLEHVHHPDRAFAEIDRVLAPGGVGYLWPAWHCVQYNCEGIPVRPYRDLTMRQRLTKLTLPVRQQPAAKALAALPRRAVRRTTWSYRRPQTTLRYRSLKPDYDTFWMSDSDAASRIDSHEGALFFASRGYEIVQPGETAIRQVMARGQPLVVRKRRPSVEH